MERPEIHYAKSGEVSIAYSVHGDGPFDLVAVPGFVSHLEFGWEEPTFARVLERLGSFARVIGFDKRGTGLSDRGIGVASLEEYVSDVRSVMDAVGSEQAALWGISEGGAIAALFAATHPERVRALVIYGGWARVAWAPDYPFGIQKELLESGANFVADTWGTGVGLSAWAPSLGKDPRMRQWWAQFQRLAASPRDVREIMSLYASIDVRQALPTITAPALVLHRKGDLIVTVESGRYLASHIPGAKYLELDGADHFPWTEDADSVLGEVEEFLTGMRQGPEPTRRLATVLFTDIVGSTQRMSEIGDRKWRDLLERHDGMVRRALSRFSGQEVNTTGDGFLALFDGPSAAIRCADAIRGGASGLGCGVRIGVHTGEIEEMGQDVGGLAVNIARRVADLAGGGEIWVSGTVPGLVVGSGIEFKELGSRSLKGISGDWPLFSVESL